jgi:hypothetical protein
MFSFYSPDFVVIHSVYFQDLVFFRAMQQQKRLDRGIGEFVVMAVSQDPSPSPQLTKVTICNICIIYKLSYSFFT